MDQLHGVEKTREGQFPNAEQRVPMSYSEFFIALDESTHAEWVNGEAIIFMPPTLRHQDIVTFLLILIGGFVNLYRLGKVWGAPCAMRLPVTGSVREPDILFLLEANLERQTESFIDGPADLVVEVISPESIKRDRREKFEEFQTNGVREYWVIDPRPKFARTDFWVLDEGKRYRPVPVGSDGIYHSTVLQNFALDVNMLLSDDLPNPLKALATMVGKEALLRALENDE